MMNSTIIIYDWLLSPGAYPKAVPTGMLMKTRSAVVALAIGFGSAAMAADFPPASPAYKAPAVPYQSWQGYYFGGNVGYGWGRSTNDLSGQTTPVFGALQGGVSDRQDVNGAIGGFQWGYNWQAANWVFGLESDLQASGQKGEARYCLIAGCATSFDGSHKLSWFGTSRSRIGALVTPGVLFYATAGLAYGQIRSDHTLIVPNVPVATVGFKDTKAGWTAGGGIEVAFGGNWSTKLEYLYLDLGKSEITASALGASATFERRFTDHIGRIGVNYRFGGYGPVSAAY